MEFLLWCNAISSISGTLGCRLEPWHSGLRIWQCCNCGVGCNCGSDLIPGPGTPYAAGWQTKQNKTKQNKTNTLYNVWEMSIKYGTE